MAKREDEENVLDRPAGTIIALEFTLEIVLRSLLSVHPQLRGVITEDLRHVSERARVKLPKPLANRALEVLDRFREIAETTTPMQ